MWSFIWINLNTQGFYELSLVKIDIYIELSAQWAKKLLKGNNRGRKRDSNGCLLLNFYLSLKRIFAFFMYKTRCVCETQMPPIMINSKDVTRTNIFIPLERSCHKNSHMQYESFIIYYLEVMNNVNLKKIPYKGYFLPAAKFY